MQIKNIPAAWVAFADVYGFKQLLKSRVQDLPGLMASLEAAYASAKPRLQATTELFTLSDNVFLLVPCAQGGSWQAYEKIVADLRVVADAFLEQDDNIAGPQSGQ